VLKDGQTMLDAFGWFTPLVGLVAAFVAAGVSLKWMVGYLQRHDLSIFGWYRLAIAALVGLLLLTNAI
jgi:undecaprenyl-diphosphatase